MRKRLKWFLCTLSGDDVIIIRRCVGQTQVWFTSIGAMVAMIFTLCFVGTYLAFDGMFEAAQIAIPLAAFYAWMMTNIYLLLLYTLSRNSFPEKPAKFQKSFAILIRLGFVCFIAFIVSKPLESTIFKSQLQEKITQLKMHNSNKFEQDVINYLNQEILVLKDLKNAATQYGNQEIADKYEALIARKTAEGNAKITQMKTDIDKSTYFIQGIQILCTELPMCWCVSGLTLILFLIPALAKNFVGRHTDYHDQKKLIEMEIVLDDYNQFKRKYSEIILSRYNRQVEYSEPYFDAPFNTVRKTTEWDLISEDVLIKELYDV